jgi:hypothetical protein
MALMLKHRSNFTLTALNSLIFATDNSAITGLNKICHVLIRREAKNSGKLGTPTFL